MIQRLWKMEGCGVGGPLHAVIDDGNLKDGHIQSVIDRAGTGEIAGIPIWWSKDAEDLGVEIARLMLQMTGTQRRKLADHNYYAYV
jgi:hypothetical protein